MVQELIQVPMKNIKVSYTGKRLSTLGVSENDYLGEAVYEIYLMSLRAW